MATITAVIATSDTVLPAGVTFDHIQITLTDAAGNTQGASVDGVTTNTATFSNVSVGDGTVIAQAMDTNGNALGSAVSASFTVPTPVVATFPQPSTVTVTVS